MAFNSSFCLEMSHSSGTPVRPFRWIVDVHTTRVEAVRQQQPTEAGRITEFAQLTPMSCDESFRPAFLIWSCWCKPKLLRYSLAFVDNFEPRTVTPTARLSGVFCIGRPSCLQGNLTEKDMFYSFMFWVAQLESDTGGAAGEAASGAAEQTSRPSGLSFLIPMMLALLVMMLLMRPKKGDQQQRQRLSELKKNDRVVTAGGIIGTVMSIREDNNYVTLRIDESTNTKMQIVKSSIIKVLGDEKAEQKPG